MTGDEFLASCAQDSDESARLTHSLIGAGIVAGIALGMLVMIIWDGVEDDTHLHAPVRAAQLEAHLEDERSVSRWTFGYYHGAWTELAYCRRHAQPCPMCVLDVDELLEGDSLRFGSEGKTYKIRWKRAEKGGRQ